MQNASPRKRYKPTRPSRLYGVAPSQKTKKRPAQQKTEKISPWIAGASAIAAFIAAGSAAYTAMNSVGSAEEVAHKEKMFDRQMSACTEWIDRSDKITMVALRAQNHDETSSTGCTHRSLPVTPSAFATHIIDMKEMDDA